MALGVWPGMNDLPELVAIPNLIIERVEARKTYDRSMCPHEHAVNDWRLHPLTPNAALTGHWPKGNEHDD